MWIDHRQIEWRYEKITVRQCDEHGSINRRIGFEDFIRRLPGRATVWACRIKRRVCHVQLAHPSNEHRGTSSGTGYIGVIGADGETWVVPS